MGLPAPRSVRNSTSADAPMLEAAAPEQTTQCRCTAGLFGLLHGRDLPARPRAGDRSRGGPAASKPGQDSARNPRNPARPNLAESSPLGDSAGRTDSRRCSTERCRDKPMISAGSDRPVRHSTHTYASFLEKVWTAPRASAVPNVENNCPAGDAAERLTAGNAAHRSSEPPTSSVRRHRRTHRPLRRRPRRCRRRRPGTSGRSFRSPSVHHLWTALRLSCCGLYLRLPARAPEGELTDTENNIASRACQ